MKVKILKMGNKLGIYFPKSYSGFKKGDLVKIKIIKDSKEKIFLTKFNYNITIRKPLIHFFDLNKDEIINIELEKAGELKKSKGIFKDNKVDLSALVPESTSNGYKIFVTNFEEDNEEWLRIWYCHKKGSGKQLEIKRYADTDIFGRLLGQLQAEGTKSGERFCLEFCNKLVKEHIDYIDYLEELGIPRNLLICSLIFHPNVKNVKRKIKDFEIQVGIPVKYVIKCKSSKGGYSFKTFMRNTLLTEIILNSLDTLRKKLVEDSWNENLNNLAGSFFAKLLTGDGTLDITTKNREYNFPETRIKITDGNLNYLKDYAAIMQKLGFKPHINEKHISVRSYAGFDKLLSLYKIKAFQNTPNWKKLIFLINENLKGRRLNTFIRSVDLLESKVFTSKDLVKKYGVGLRAANDWLNNKEKEGFIVRVDKNRPIKWTLTNKARELAETLKLHQGDFVKLDIDLIKDVSQLYIKNKTILRK